jgi:hypothetical protein
MGVSLLGLASSADDAGSSGSKQQRQQHNPNFTARRPIGAAGGLYFGVLIGA